MKFQMSANKSLAARSSRCDMHHPRFGIGTPSPLGGGRSDFLLVSVGRTSARHVEGTSTERKPDGDTTLADTVTT